MDNINPSHYKNHPSGVECIAITEHFNFCIGNAIKYLWRADLKNGLEDLRKAQWYINREIQRRENQAKQDLRTERDFLEQKQESLGRISRPTGYP